MERDIATVWARYELSTDGAFNHCGVDHFDLIRQNGTWRIYHRTWTNQKKAPRLAFEPRSAASETWRLHYSTPGDLRERRAFCTTGRYPASRAFSRHCLADSRK